MERLPEDIVANILLRAPVETLVEIRYVCKSWYGIISNSKRLNIHKLLIKSRNSPQLSIFDYKDYDDNSDAAAVHDPHHHHNNISTMIAKLDYPPELEGGQYSSSLGSCNGLFCLIFDFNQIVIWNPSLSHDNYIIVEDEYHSQLSYNVYGFGYDSLSDDYKVVKVLNTLGYTAVDVFNLKSDSWREVHKPNFSYESYYISSGQLNNLLNGSLHWIIRKGGDDENEYPIFLVAFSLAEEKFLEVPKPDIDGSDKFREMCVFDGFLCLSRMDHVESGVEFWVMKEYMARASWTKLCTVLWESIPNFHNHKIFSPLCSSRDGDIFLGIGGVGVVKYNMKEKRCTSTIIELEELEYDRRIEVLVHVESLVSPYFDETCDTNTDTN